MTKKKVGGVLNCFFGGGNSLFNFLIGDKLKKKFKKPWFKALKRDLI